MSDQGSSPEALIAEAIKQRAHAVVMATTSQAAREVPSDARAIAKLALDALHAAGFYVGREEQVGWGKSLDDYDQPYSLCALNDDYPDGFGGTGRYHPSHTVPVFIHVEQEGKL